MFGWLASAVLKSTWNQADLGKSPLYTKNSFILIQSYAELASMMCFLGVRGSLKSFALCLERRSSCSTFLHSMPPFWRREG